MRYNVEDLVTSVRITLDENRIEQEYIVSEDNNMELNEIIREKLLDAVRSVERIAPVQMLDSVPMTAAATAVRPTTSIRQPENTGSESCLQCS